MEQITLGHIEVDASKFDATIDLNALPLLPTRSFVMFPDTVYPLTITREESKRLVIAANEKNCAIGICAQNESQEAWPLMPEQLAQIGVVAQVIKVVKVPDNNILAFIRANHKIQLTGTAVDAPKLTPECIMATATGVKDTRIRPDDGSAMMLEECRKIMRAHAESEGQNMEIYDMQNEQFNHMPMDVAINTLAMNPSLTTEARLQLLGINSQRKRLHRLFEMLIALNENSRVMREIEQRAREKMTDNARRQFLETQVDELRTELYGTDANDASELRKRVAELQLTDELRQQLENEIHKLERLHPNSPDYQTQYAYLKVVCELPWGVQSVDATDFAEAEKVLNVSHFGMPKVKERVLEQLAMMIHSPRSHAPILCLVGPPGVGKTSLGESIARAMGRKFQRVSLGGLHDESEIRGHRRTYIGAMPGRIIDAMRRAGTMNPIIMLDEIDKVGKDYKGDPEAALLEVLDPEQNVKFHDNYIDLDFDLSGVMFITTANTLSTISAPLLDRMETIEVSGYSVEEKMNIAADHLLVQLRSRMGLEEGECAVSPEAINAIINGYTAESGVRRLQKQLAALLRKYIMAKVSGRDFPQPILPDHLKELLGVAPISRDQYGTDGQAGVVTGLAWTAVGGEVLYIETALTQGKGNSTLTLTGNLGDVMKESAALAHRYALVHAPELGIRNEIITRDVHIHVPEGAIPKDGPSAGITITTAIVSALTGRPVRPNVAMTGEMTLRGKVLPVGGIKEKALAAKRAGVREIIICADNRRNVEEIPAPYLEGLTFHYVTTLPEVLALALT